MEMKHRIFGLNVLVARYTSPSRKNVGNHQCTSMIGDMAKNKHSRCKQKSTYFEHRVVQQSKPRTVSITRNKDRAPRTHRMCPQGLVSAAATVTRLRLPPNRQTARSQFFFSILSLKRLQQVARLIVRRETAALRALACLRSPLECRQSAAFNQMHHRVRFPPRGDVDIRRRRRKQKNSTELREQTASFVRGGVASCALSRRTRPTAAVGNRPPA